MLYPFIAEGRRRGSRKDYRQFLLIAYASGAELETQIEISFDLGYLNSDIKTSLLEKLDHQSKMLNKFIVTL